MTIPVTLTSAAEAASPAVISQKLGIEVENMNADLSRQLGYTAGEDGVVIALKEDGLAFQRQKIIVEALGLFWVSGIRGDRHWAWNGYRAFLRINRHDFQFIFLDFQYTYLVAI